MAGHSFAQFSFHTFFINISFRLNANFITKMPFCASIRQFFDCTKGNKKGKIFFHLSFSVFSLLPISITICFVDDGTMWLVVKQENAAEPEIVKNLDEKLINASVTTVERLECPIPTTFVV